MYHVQFSQRIDPTPLEKCRQKYTLIRKITHELLEDELLRAFRRHRIDVTHIDDDAIDAVAQQWSSCDRHCEFDWPGIMRTVRRSHPRALELAMWSGDKLCGLAVARLSDAKTWLSITHLEGCPDAEHPLKKRVVPAVIAGAQIYAAQVQLHDKQRRLPTLRIMRPLEKAIEWYRDLGYSETHTHKGDGKKYTFVVNSPWSAL